MTWLSLPRGTLPPNMPRASLFCWVDCRPFSKVRPGWAQGHGLQRKVEPVCFLECQARSWRLRAQTVSTGLWVFASRCGVSKSAGLNYSFTGKFLGFKRREVTSCCSFCPSGSLDGAETSCVLCLFSVSWFRVSSGVPII